MVLLGALAAAPAAVIAWSLLTPKPEIWKHLWETRLPEMLVSTLGLLVLVVAGTLVLGGGLAWLVSGYQFPGRRLFTWLLVLPLAIPGYILGFVFMSVFGFTGPLQKGLRAVFGPDVWVPEIRSIWGAAIVFSLCLYPYVFLLARASMREQATASYEVARSLGYSHLNAAFRVVLPMARPSIVAGLTLVMLETLTDYATVLYFNVQTLSVGVYRVWKGMFDRQAASQLASLVLLFALTVFVIERVARGKARYEQQGGAFRPLPHKVLHGPKAWLATGACMLVVGVAFAAPLLQLIWWAATEALSGRQGFDLRYFGYLGNSTVLAIVAASLVAIASVAVANAKRFAGNRTIRTMSHLTTTGYALPGPVIAIGVLLVLAGLDKAFAAVGISTGLLVTGTLAGVIYAYLVRFLALGVNSVEASMQKVPNELTLTARSLGATPAAIAARIHLPLMKTGVLTALMLVAIDSLKELPMVLLLRPFGFDTLPVWVWQLASESRWQSAALPALTIIAASLIPVVLLTRSLREPGAPPPALPELRVERELVAL